MGVYNILKGHNIPLVGEAEQKIEVLPQSKFVSLQTTEFTSLKFSLLVREGDEVKVGTPLCTSKLDEELVFASTAAGKVHKIVRGPKRVLLAIIIEVSNTEDSHSVDSWDSAKIQASTVAEVSSHLKKGGMWPLVRQRPFSNIADSTVLPKAVFVNAMSTAPLAPSQEFLVEGREAAFALGLEAMAKFAQVELCIASDSSSEVFTQANAKVSKFSGVHPAGLTGTHINEISPINKGETVWYLTAAQVALIGEFLQNGVVPSHDIIALTGSKAPKNIYAKVNRGAMASTLVGETGSDARIISGDVLNGATLQNDEYISFYKSQVTVVPEGGRRYYPDEDKYWLGPGFNSYSVWPLFMSKIVGKLKWDLDTNMNGGDRAIVQQGVYEKYSPFNIHFTALVKAILAEDVDEMEQLGLYELDPEDVALATFICPSKIDVSGIVSRGLAILEKEG